MRMQLISLFAVWITVHLTHGAVDVDPMGYVVYCPCMGRFGNQMEHFLGSIAFAKGLNRTLVLPPWVEYRPGNSRSVQIAFDTYFKVEPLKEYHGKVITMEKFMKELAPRIWRPGKRTVYCYTARTGTKPNDCNAKDGNPFGSFWDTFNIDFDKSEFYGGIGYNTQFGNTKQKWEQKYPTPTNMVLAFTGAPAGFPVIEEHVGIQRYLEWSDDIDKRVQEFIDRNLPSPILGIHMRNGADWVRACEHADSSRNLFASPQCLGYKMQLGKLTKDICFPPEKTVLHQIKTAVKKMKAKSVFVASDSDHMIGKIEKEVGKKVRVAKLRTPSPHVDLAILGRADHYIGNCVSTFSAIATRERRPKNKEVEFWAFKAKDHDEL